MRMNRTRIGSPLGVILLALLGGSTALACNIPVFRYALERWSPDQCEVVVFHDGPLSAEPRQQLDRLRFDSREQPRDYLKITLAGLQDPAAPHQDLWTAVKADAKSLPYAVVRTTLGPGRVVNGWHGPLSEVDHAGVIQSPARRELSQRLLAGHAIVWLIIGSGNDQRNADAREMLESNFESLADKIELPEGIGLPGSELHSEVPLLLRYSTLEIDRSNPDERFLIKLLSSFQLDAFDDGEPLIVPVFGRGRALEVIPAVDLTPRLMEDLTRFLSGACSCQVKEQNPGFDLLLAVDWNTELFGEVGPPPPRTTRDQQGPILLTIPPGN